MVENWTNHTPTATRAHHYGPLQPLEHRSALHRHAYPENGLNWWQGTALLGVLFGVAAAFAVAFAP